MAKKRLTPYPADHWLSSPSPRAVLAASARQQGLAYSRVKNALLWELLIGVTGARFLDFGCGAGHFTVEAAKRGARLAVGLDAMPSALGAAALLGRSEGVDGRCRFIAANSLSALDSHARFEAILLRDVLEHVPDDAGLLVAAARLLAPGGRLVLATQNAWSLNYWIEGGIRRYLLGQRNWLGWDSTHLRFYTPPSLAGLLARAGLRPTAWRSAYLVPHKIPAWPGAGRQYFRLEGLTALDRTLGRVSPFSRLGWSLMVRAEP